MKVIKITKCGECPHHRRKGIYRCVIKAKEIEDLDVISEWCTLEDGEEVKKSGKKAFIEGSN